MRLPAFAIRAALAIIALATTCPAIAQPVVPSGTTATTATTLGNGHVNVGIAPPNASGISLNQYQNFSVPSAGVDLINQGVNANTIINQVISSNRSFLQGPLTVVGPAAHVIIANPNGISVDGASFINTGGVALSTGTVSFQPSATNPGGVDTVLNTGAGDILVTGTGLNGSMASLQLIAGRIKIDGPVVNSHPAGEAEIELVAGSANVTLNSAVFAGSTLSKWATRQDLGGAANEILIDVTPNGRLSASRIHLAVGAAGAGVAFAGKGLASIGEFTITAAGKVSIAGGSIQAEKAVKIAAPAIEVLNTPLRQAEIASLTGGVTLLAGQGDITITGYVTGATRDPNDPESKGGVTLSAPNGNISLLSENADRLAIVFASNDDLVAKAGGNITNNTGRLLSNRRVFLTAGGTLTNIVERVGTVNDGEPIVTRQRGNRIWWWPFGRRTRWTSLTVTAGSLRIPDQLAYIVGASVFIDAANVVNSGEIDAQSGALVINTGTLTNLGIATGSASYLRRCGVTCNSDGWSDVTVSGGTINAAGSLLITASTEIINDGGVILSYGNMALETPRITATAIFVPGISTRPGGLYNAFSGETAFLTVRPLGGQFLAPTGTITVTTGEPVHLDGGELVAGAGVINPAGEDVIQPAAVHSNLRHTHIGLLRWIWE